MRVTPTYDNNRHYSIQKITNNIFNCLFNREITVDQNTRFNPWNQNDR